MNSRVNKTLKGLVRNGMVRAFIEIEEKEYCYPEIIDLKTSIREKVKVGIGIFLFLVFLFILLNPWKYLNRHKISVDITTDRFGMGPLHHAVIKPEESKVVQLVQEKHNINLQDEYGWTPLHWAVFKNNEGICRFLLQNGASPTIKSLKKWFKYPEGITPIEIAILLKADKITEIFREKNAQ